MARRVFFSFKYEDVSRAMVVRNSWVIPGRTAAGFVDAAEFEAVKRQGDNAIKRWINGQLEGTSVTVVLVGAETCRSRWVKYEIDRSKARGNGLLGIDISKIKDFKQNTSERCGEIPAGYPFYLWYKNKGYENMGTWIEQAAKAAGKLYSLGLPAKAKCKVLNYFAEECRVDVTCTQQFADLFWCELN
jgi:hypothetical protein